MDSKALDRLLSEVKDSLSRTRAPAPIMRTEVVQARRVTDDDWRLTLEGTRTLADRLEAVIHAAPDAAQGTCRALGRQGRHHVRLELGCRGPVLLASLLEAVIDDHANTHPEVHLQAVLQVDDSMRPRLIDLLVPSGAAEQQVGPMLGMLGLGLELGLGLGPAQPGSAQPGSAQPGSAQPGSAQSV